MPWVDIGKCTGCKICVEKCPVNAISMGGGKSKDKYGRVHPLWYMP